MLFCFLPSARAHAPCSGAAFSLPAAHVGVSLPRVCSELGTQDSGERGSCHTAPHPPVLLRPFLETNLTADHVLGIGRACIRDQIRFSRWVPSPHFDLQAHVLPRVVTLAHRCRFLWMWTREPRFLLAEARAFLTVQAARPVPSPPPPAASCQEQQ